MSAEGRPACRHRTSWPADPTCAGLIPSVEGVGVEPLGARRVDGPSDARRRDGRAHHRVLGHRRRRGAGRPRRRRGAVPGPRPRQPGRRPVRVPAGDPGHARRLRPDPGRAGPAGPRPAARVRADARRRPTRRCPPRARHGPVPPRLPRRRRTRSPCCRTWRSSIVDAADPALPSLVHQAHAAGVRVLAARVDRRTDENTCRAAGVDGIRLGPTSHDVGEIPTQRTPMRPGKVLRAGEMQCLALMHLLVQPDVAVSDVVAGDRDRPGAHPADAAPGEQRRLRPRRAGRHRAAGRRPARSQGGVDARRRPRPSTPVPTPWTGSG